jgi:hypothetical protein
LNSKGSAHEGEPDDVAPSEVEAEVVVGDVDGAEVPVLVDEEVHHVPLTHEN